MKKYYAFLFLAGFLNMCLVPSASAQAVAARASVEDFLNSIKDVQKVNRANAYLDLEVISQKALGDHWPSASEEQKQTFLALLQALIEKVAYPQSRKFLDNLPIEYKDPTPLEKGVEVATVVKNQEEGLDAPIVYQLYEAEGNWKIYDILLDGVALTEDFKFQFDTIIRESSFDGLLDRMRERLAAAEKEAEAAPAN